MQLYQKNTKMIAIKEQKLEKKLMVLYDTFFL